MSKPVYVSLTSISKNQSELFLTLQSMLRQTKRPDKVFIYLSEEPSFFDEGFKNKVISHKELNDLLSQHSDLFHVAWGSDIGPYGKLLPILKDKWNEDCCIITIDDDTEYHQSLVENLFADYEKHNCVISYRGFVPNIKHVSEMTYDNRIMNIGLLGVSKDHHKHLYNFSTGKGGVLYHPSFFHKTENLIFEKKIYLESCATADDVWFVLVRILNNVPCYLEGKQWYTKDNSTCGLFVNFNHNNNKNNVHIRKTIERLKQICDFTTEKRIIDFYHENERIVFHCIQNDHIGKTWERNVFYEDRLLDYIKRLELHGTYVDVGAHHGNHSIYFSKYCIPEKVVAIEGNPFNYECLRTNISENRCNNIQMINCIATNVVDSTMQMSYGFDNTGASMIVENNYKCPSNMKMVSNKTNLLDNLLDSTENICLIKIDVQKHEYETLLGCVITLKKHRPVLAVSIHANVNEAKIRQFLKDNHYVTNGINYGVSGTFIYTPLDLTSIAPSPPKPLAKPTIFNFGLPRTGTTSFHMYMQKQGYQSAHTNDGFIEKCFPEQYNNFINGIKLEENIIMQYIHKYDVLSDLPWYSTQLRNKIIEMYKNDPNAIFVCTTREHNAWINSIKILKKYIGSTTEQNFHDFEFNSIFRKEPIDEDALSKYYMNFHVNMPNCVTRLYFENIKEIMCDHKLLKMDKTIEYVHENKRT